MERWKLQWLEVLVVMILLMAVQTPFVFADSSSDVYVKVAVLDSTAYPPYALGGMGNWFAEAIEVLDKDPYIIAENVTNMQIQAGILTSQGFDVLLLVDNWPENASNSYIMNFWNNSGGIIALDSSIEFLCYAGILPSESAGSNGFNVYWDYETTGTAKISAVHPVTAGYIGGENITGTWGNARYNITALAGTANYTHYTQLAEDYANPNFAYVSAYEPPNAGRVVHIWESLPDELPIRLLLINAVKWVAQRSLMDILLDILLELDILEARVNILETQLGNLETQLNTLETQLGNLETQLNTLGVQLDALQDQVDSLEVQLNTLNTTLTSELAGLETRIDDLETEIGNLNADINTVNSALTSRLDDSDAQLSTTTLISYGGIVVGVIGVVLAIVAIMLGRKGAAP